MNVAVFGEQVHRVADLVADAATYFIPETRIVVVLHRARQQSSDVQVGDHDARAAHDIGCEAFPSMAQDQVERH